jgi:hypothetical protein
MVVRSSLFRTRVVAVTVLGLLLFVTKLFAQGNAPAYLAEMPSVERVMQAMRASDPDETAARQMAAFTHLKNMIEKLAGPRFPKNQLTPEENKLRQAYYTAYWQIAKSKPQYGSFNAMRGLDIDIKFRDEVIQKCFPPSFAAEYSKLTGQAIAQNKALHDQGAAARAEREQALADQAAKEHPNAQKITVADVQAELASGGSKDPQELAMRRCIAAGRLPSSCTGNALLGSFSSMISSALSGVTGTPTNTAGSPTNVPPDAGPNMSGVFQGAGNWRLDFVDGGVLVNCSSLSPNQEAYSLAFRSAGAILTINTKPKPLVLEVHADGTITGPPGTVTIDGVIATGYHTGLHNAAGQQVTANEARYSTQPVYNDSGVEVTDPVNGYSTFSPRRATCPAISLTSKGTGPGIQTMQMNVLKTAFGGDAGPATPVGIRMHGIFAAASTGFSLQFFPESVILGCGPISARAYPYTVSGNGLIKIDAADHPLSVTIRPDGSLDPGSGPYQVHGRMTTGPTLSDKYTFLPVDSTCTLAPLTPARNIPSTGGSTPHP